VRQIGRADLHFHDLRHIFASTLIAGGVNVALVARLMGHSTPQVTLTVYSHFFESDFSKARKTLDA
jgi:integrase